MPRGKGTPLPPKVPKVFEIRGLGPDFKMGFSVFGD